MTSVLSKAERLLLEKQKPNSSYFLWSGFWSRSHLHRAKVMPRHFLILLLQPDICSTKIPFLRQIFAELKKLKLFFPLKYVFFFFFFTLHLFPAATTSYWIRPAACSRAVFGRQGVWTRGSFPKNMLPCSQHRSQSSKFCLKGLKRSGVTETPEKRHSSDIKYSAPIVNIMQDAGIAKLYFWLPLYKIMKWLSVSTRNPDIEHEIPS